MATHLQVQTMKNLRRIRDTTGRDLRPSGHLHLSQMYWAIARVHVKRIAY